MNCNNCGSENTKSAGVLVRGKDLIRYRQYVCSDCGHRDEFVEGVKNVGHVIEGKQARYVVTSTLNNKSVDKKFLKVLKNYCSYMDAKLLVIPVRYINEMNGDDVWYPEEVREFIIEDNLTIPDAHCKILGGLRISATAENPLSGIDPMSKGDSLIIGHPQVQMRTLPVVAGISPILWTTGTVSENAYSDTKTGYKAAFNHSQSALLVDFSDATLHIRNLNYDGEGFNDLEYRYGKSRTKQRVCALVTGDEHALFADPDVKKATYTNSDSIVNILKPEYICRADVLDFYSQTHHDRNNFVGKFKKYIFGLSNLTTELDITKKFIEETTPPFATNVIISSNHHDHLLKWLNEADPKQDPENALLYHKLMVLVLEAIKNGEDHIDAFEIWLKTNMISKKILFTRRESFKLLGVELGCHSDKGINGARGSRASFSKLPDKMIISHGHSPGIEKGCYQVGVSSSLEAGYTKGSPSSWAHAHCVLHINGNRQMVFIRNGRWR